MPELPDLEIFKSNIMKRLSSKRLTGLNVFNSAKALFSESSLREELCGRELLDVDRVGKELYFDFGGGRVVSAHLMLNGKMEIVPREAVSSINYKIFSFDFENESLVFSDMGSLCTIKYQPSPDKAPDAFGPAFTLDYFLSAAHKKPRTNVKAFLIDQNIVKGIGNAYADEILWEARISPCSLVGKIPADALAALYNAIGAVLRNAVESIRQICPDIISGEERGFLKVHNKKLKSTETGHRIVIEKIASKTTYYTDEQVLYL